MDFLTIGQYFNRLHSALFALLIIPLLVFTALYLYPTGSPPDPGPGYAFVIPGLVVLDWLWGWIIVTKKIKSVRLQQGLGAKLEKYFKLTIVRYCILSSASLLLALGLYLTRSDTYTAMYGAGMLIAGIGWPTPAKVSSDLQLRGDEREMVYFKKDRL